MASVTPRRPSASVRRTASARAPERRPPEADRTPSVRGLDARPQRRRPEQAPAFRSPQRREGTPFLRGPQWVLRPIFETCLSRASAPSSRGLTARARTARSTGRRKTSSMRFTARRSDKGSLLIFVAKGLMNLVGTHAHWCQGDALECCLATVSGSQARRWNRGCGRIGCGECS